MSTWRVILATLVIFCAGLFAGALSVKLLVQHRPVIIPGQRFRTEMLTRMTRELEINADQRRRIEAILAESQERNREIMSLVGPELREEFRRTTRQIQDVLDGEQRKRFDELLQQSTRRAASQSSLERRAPPDDPP